MRTERLLKNLANTGVTREQMRTAVHITMTEELDHKVEYLIHQAFDEHQPLHEAIMPLQYKR